MCQPLLRPVARPPRGTAPGTRRGSAVALLAWAALGLLGSVPVPVLGAPGPAPEDPAKALALAVHSGDVEGAQTAIDELATTDTSRSWWAIIKYALNGDNDNYDIERYAGGVLATSGSAAARKEVIAGLAKNRNYKTRVVLLAVAARWASDDPGSLEAIHDAVRDPSPRVVVAALGWIRRLGSLQSLNPLVEALAARERKAQDRVYFDIKRTLEAITNQEFENSADWKNYADGLAGGRPKKKKKRRGKSMTVLYRPPSFFDLAVESSRVLFVIDVSQSMLVRDEELPPDESESTRIVGVDPDAKGSGKTVVRPGDDPTEGGKDTERRGDPALDRERLTRVKNELIKVVSSLAPTVRFGILKFDHETAFFGGSGSLQTATRSMKSSAVSWVSALQARGATRTDLALSLALGIPDVDTIYLLTDGAPRDERNVKIPVDLILDNVKRENRFRKVRIHTISFQQVKNAEMRRFVKELAKENDGECRLLR